LRTEERNFLGVVFGFERFVHALDRATPGAGAGGSGDGGQFFSFASAVMAFTERERLRLKPGVGLGDRRVGQPGDDASRSLGALPQCPGRPVARAAPQPTLTCRRSPAPLVEGGV
jgi:hypothetical protein